MKEIPKKLQKTFFRLLKNSGEKNTYSYKCNNYLGNFSLPAIVSECSILGAIELEIYLDIL